MNFCALDNALAYIENGYINEEFIMNDMLKSIQCIDESIEAITESESFFEKAKAAIKKVIEAIGKFFSTIWKRYKKWSREMKDKIQSFAAEKILNLKINTNKEYKDFVYNDKKYKMPVDFYKTMEIILTPYAATNKPIEDPEEYIKSNLTYKNVAAAECMDLYQLFNDDCKRIEHNLDDIAKNLEESKKTLTEDIKKLDAIAKLSPLESKKAFVELLDDKNAKIVFGQPQAGLITPPEAKAEALIKKDELKKVNNCLKCAAVVIKIKSAEEKRIATFYPQLIEKAKQIMGVK